MIHISNIKKGKYPFKKEYLNKLLARYKENRGLHKVHFVDLPQDCILEFNKEGHAILNQIFTKVKLNYGLDAIHRKHNVNFYSLQDFLNNKQIGLSVKKIISFKRFLEKVQLDILNLELLEKCVLAIKPPGRGNKLKID